MLRGLQRNSHQAAASSRRFDARWLYARVTPRSSSTAQAVRALATDAVRENLANYALARRERPRLYSDVPCDVLCWRELAKRNGREKFAAE